MFQGKKTIPQINHQLQRQGSLNGEIADHRSTRKKNETMHKQVRGMAALRKVRVTALTVNRFKQLHILIEDPSSKGADKEGV